MMDLDAEEFFEQFDSSVRGPLLDCYRNYAPARVAMRMAMSGQARTLDALATGIVFLSQQCKMLIDERLKCLQNHPQSLVVNNEVKPAT